MDDGCTTALKQRYIHTRLHGITSQSTVIFMLYVVNLVIDPSTDWNIIGSSRQLGSCGRGAGRHNCALRFDAIGLLMLCHLDSTTCLSHRSSLISTLCDMLQFRKHQFDVRPCVFTTCGPSSVTQD